MDKILFKFYTTFIAFFIIVITIFPFLFININNMFDLIKTKLLIYTQHSDINITIDRNKANIIIMFDDGWKNQYDIAYKYMQKLNMRGSVSIIPLEINNQNYMNMANIYELYNNHWDILNHTYHHHNLNQLDYNDQLIEMKQSLKWFTDKKIDNNLNILVYPEGDFNTYTINILKELKITNSRSSFDGYNTNIINNQYDIKIKNITSNIIPKQVNDWINYAINNKLSIILVFHKIDDKDITDMGYKIKNFYSIIDYIYLNKDNLNIITYSDWVRSIN